MPYTLCVYKKFNMNKIILKNKLIKINENYHLLNRFINGFSLWNPEDVLSGLRCFVLWPTFYFRNEETGNTTTLITVEINWVNSFLKY